ncbi:MAG: RDD family protein [Opitutaceae bacterium]|nr:RDD family protein [Opitutaceae bacterium]
MSATPPPPPAPGRTVKPEILVVSPAVLGQPLAEPWRRLVAMALDLTVVGALSFLSGPWLGIGTGCLLVVLFGNSPSAPITQKSIRWICRGLGILIAMLAILAFGQGPLVRKEGLHLDVITGREVSAAMRETIWIAPEATAREVAAAAGKLQAQVEDLKRENRELTSSQASWVYQARGFANALGVTFGWSGVYFTLVAGSFRGRTLGKRLLGIRPVKTNGTDFTFFDAFLRHGGYVAGVAMGLMGFLKILWEPNRQGVEDRIGGTVVIRDFPSR